MGQNVVLKSEVRNVILATQRVAIELAKRSPTPSEEMEAYLDGFWTALEAIATGLGVEVTIEHPSSLELREWREIRDTLEVLPAFSSSKNASREIEEIETDQGE